MWFDPLTLKSLKDNEILKDHDSYWSQHWPTRPTSLSVDKVRFPNMHWNCHSPSIGLMLRTWWRHQMEKFSALLALCAGNSPVAGEFPAQRSVTRSFDVFYDLRLNKRLSKHSWGWWFETPSRPLWRHCNAHMHWKCHSSSIRLMLSIK